MTTLKAAAETVDPGSQVAFTLEIRNRGQTVDHLSVEVLGDAAAWAEVEPSSVNLMPGTSATAMIRFRPPRSPAVRAGRVHIAIAVRSSEHPNDPIVEQGTLAINPFTAVDLDVAPRRVRGRDRGTFTIRAANDGNAPASVAIAFSDPERSLGFTATPSMLQVEPGAVALAAVTVAAGKAPLLGSSRTRQFQVVATPTGGDRRIFDGTFEQRALLPVWVPAILVLVLAIAGALIAKPFSGNETGSIATASPPSTNQALSSGSAAVVTAEPTPTATAQPSTPPPAAPITPPPPWWQDAFDGATAAGINLGTPDKAGTTTEKLRYQGFSNGALFERTSGVYAISDAIWRKWRALGGSSAAPASLGYPTSQTLGPDLDHRHQLFDNGAIFWTASTDAHVVTGPVWTSWQALVKQGGGDVAAASDPAVVAGYGYPTGDATSQGGDWSIQTEGGGIGVCANGRAWQCETGKLCLMVCHVLEPMTLPPIQP